MILYGRMPFDGDQNYLKAALAAGFTEQQATFLWETFALDPHEHTADQIFRNESEEESLDEVWPEVED